MKKAAAILFTAISIALHIPVAAQTERYEEIASESLQREIVEHLCDSVMEGRGSGTGGGMLAHNYILDRFEQLNLKPFYFRRQESFFYNEKITMHNVMGVVPAVGITDKYIVVSAHYDHLGVIKGKTYPGADDNASGVAALLALAQMFSQMRQDGTGPAVNILFVAFDGKEYSMAGSKRFVANLPIATQDIICEINMDILGSTLVPVRKNPEYLIVLGRNTLPENMRNIVANCNWGRNLNLDIDFTFYGSDDFTRTIYKLSDHYAFNQKGIPALFFTSGFHQHTLKTTDTPAIIDYKVLSKRTKLIFNTIVGIANVSNN